MGGYVIGRSLEQYPRLYDGALPMCGVMGDQRLIDYFLDYNLTAQALAGMPAYPRAGRLPDGRGPGDPGDAGHQQRSTRWRRSRPTTCGTQFRDITVNLTGGPRPGAAAVVRVLEGLRLLAGRPDRRARHDGAGPGPDRHQPVHPLRAEHPGRRQPHRRAGRPGPAVGAAVRRAHPGAADRRPAAGAGAVPARASATCSCRSRWSSCYRADVARHGRGRLLVQRAIRATGHCEFSPAEAGAGVGRPGGLGRGRRAAGRRPGPTAGRWRRPTTDAASPTRRRT